MKMQEIEKLLNDLEELADLHCVEFEDLKELIVSLQNSYITVSDLPNLITDLQEVENLTL